MDPEWEARRALVALLDDLFAGTDAPFERHLELRFYALLTPSERRRLQRLFPAELDLVPSAASPAVRARWDVRARAFLTRGVAFLARIDSAGLLPVVAADARDPRSVAALTINGSLLSIGPGPSPARMLRYAPLHDRLAPIRRRARLERGLAVGRAPQLTTAALSPLLGLALDPACREDPAAIDGIGERPSDPGQAEALARYALVADQHSAARRTGAPSPMLDAELLAAAIELQGDEGLTLGEVASFEDARALYGVIDHAGGHDLLVRRADADARVRDVAIDPQRIALGAPLVLSSATGRILRCTGAITAVRQRLAARASR